MAGPPEELNGRKAIEAIEWVMWRVQSMEGAGQCAHEDDCTFLPVWEDIQGMMVSQLESTTFADLASGVDVKTRDAVKSASPGRKRSPRTVGRGGGSQLGPVT